MNGAEVFPPVEALLFIAGNKRHHTKRKCSVCTTATASDVILERVETFEANDEEDGDNGAVHEAQPHAQATPSTPVETCTER